MKGEVGEGGGGGEREKKQIKRRRRRTNASLSLRVVESTKEKGNGRNMRGGEKKRRLNLTQRRQNKETG